MSQLTSELTEKLLDACKAGAGDAGGSLSSALENAMQVVDVQDGGAIDVASLPEELSGPGLALSFHVGEEALVLLLPEATNLLPPWYAEPDPTGESKLQTLAQELSMLLLPEDLPVGDFAATAATDLADAVLRAELANSASSVALSVSGDDGSGTFFLFWPLSKPGQLRQVNFNAAKPSTKRERDAADEDDHDVESLPSYSRSLLQIRVPVIVNLASTKMTVDDVVHLGPGAIIHFEKSCEDSLDLEAGGHKIAEGEAVKVGDKFGLRIRSIKLPDERYKTVGK